MWQVWDFEHTWSLVTLSFLLQNVETVIRVTSDQCPGRPRGLSLQGTIPSLSAMVFSCPGGAFFKAICWLKDVARSCSSRSRSSAAATTKVAAEQLTAGAGQQEGHVDTAVKSCQELEICVL